MLARRGTLVNTATRKTNPWAVLAVFALGTFLTLLDLTIVNIAIPSIVDDIHAPLDGIQWILNAYSIAYAVLLITAARVAPPPLGPPHARIPHSRCSGALPGAPAGPYSPRRVFR